MNALVPIGTGEFPVLARDLHKALAVKRQYADWWKNQRMGPSDYASGLDLLHVGVKRHGGQNRLDHHLTLDACKRIAMMAKTAKGDEVREYFLACEDAAGLSRAMARSGPESEDALVLRAVRILEGRVQAAERRALAAETIAEDRRPAQEWADDVSAGEHLVDTKTALIQASVPGCVRLTRAMWHRLGEVYFNTDGPRRWRSSWPATGFGEDVPTTVGKGRGRKQVNVPKWTPKGVLHLREWLLEGQRQKAMPRRSSLLPMHREAKR